MISPIGILLVLAVSLVLLVVRRVTHARRGGEAQPTNSSFTAAPSFREVVSEALLALKELIDEVADSPAARNCHKAPELLREVYDLTVSQTRHDPLLHPDRCQPFQVRAVIGHHLRRAWRRRVRNKRKRQLLQGVQDSWATTYPTADIDLSPCSSITTSGCS